MLLDPEFRPLLSGFDLEALERDPATIFGMWADTRIGYVNPAYLAFAREGGDTEIASRWGLGSRAIDSVPEPLRAFYQGVYARALSGPRPVTHRYLCHSPELERQYALQLYRLDEGRGLLAVHSLVVARPHSDPKAPSASRYRDERGIVVQCAHCRRVRCQATPDQWDLVPLYVARSPDGTSHGLCSVCASYHYPSH